MTAVTFKAMQLLHMCISVIIDEVVVSLIRQFGFPIRTFNLSISMNAAAARMNEISTLIMHMCDHWTMSGQLI
jgi:hypothetical protein